MNTTKVLPTDGESVIISKGEYANLLGRVANLESFVREYLFKRRELAIIEMGDIEVRLGMARTKEKRK